MKIHEPARARLCGYLTFFLGGYLGVVLANNFLIHWVVAFFGIGLVVSFWRLQFHDVLQQRKARKEWFNETHR